MKKQLDTLEQMSVSLKVINEEIGDMLKFTKRLLYFLIFNSVLISVGFVKFMFFSA